ncbi:MAG: hypothetical protein HY905_03605 [Deltaproteobacteria bacterium]|nr:hypothetical protein [Deltaproteobacteria bacterium]
MVASAGCGGNTNLTGDGEFEGETAEVDLGPPVPDAGTGWRDSSEPWAPPPRVAEDCQWQNYAFDLWPGSDGLYALYAVRFTRHEIARSLEVRVNGGDGWTGYFSGDSPCYTPRYLAGTIGEALIAAGTTVDTSSTVGTLAAISPEGLRQLVECDVPPVTNAFVVSDTLAYATVPAPDAVPVLRFDGEGWSEMVEGPIPVVRPLPLLWADDDDLFMAGGGGLVVSREGTGWYIHDIGTTNDVVSLWGFDGDDVWAGDTSGELFHFDGTTWASVAWPNVAATGNLCDSAVHAALGLWGSDGVLYISAGDLDPEHAGVDPVGAVSGSGDAIVRYDGAFEVIAHWPPSNRAVCENDGVKIWRVRGTSANEVFVMAEGRPDPVTGCKRPFVLLWDGSEFRWI